MRVIHKEVYLDKINLHDRLEILEKGIPGSGGSIDIITKEYTDTQVGTRLSKNGDIMLGPLLLSNDPTQPTEATTKQYVDATVIAAASNRLSKLGDVMYGELVLAGDAVQDFSPVTKRQLDSSVANVVQTGLLDW